MTYDSTATDDIVWGFGLGCQGSVTVLFERLAADGGPFPLLARAVEDREPSVLSTAVSGPGLGHRESVAEATIPTGRVQHRAAEFLGSGSSAIEMIDGESWLFESIQPPLALTIFGGGHDAIPLVDAAKSLGWFVTVVDHRPAFADSRRFPGADRVVLAAPEAIGVAVELEPASAIVIMSHNYLTDQAILGRVLRLPLCYVGQLGPRVRTDRMLIKLADDDCRPTQSELEKLHAPVGLDLGGASPEVIALGVVAEIQAVIQGRPAVNLRGRVGPLHEPSPVTTIGGRAEPIVCQVSQ